MPSDKNLLLNIFVKPGCLRCRFVVNRLIERGDEWCAVVVWNTESVDGRAEYQSSRGETEDLPLILYDGGELVSGQDAIDFATEQS